MTRKDVPYVICIALCMMVSFLSGRYSVSTAPAVARAPIAATPPALPATLPPQAPAPAVPSLPTDEDRAHSAPVIPIEALPTAGALQALAEPKPKSEATKSTVARPAGEPVVPEKIELEEDPPKLEKAAKPAPMVAPTPGF